MIQWGALVLMIVGVIGKFGALFVSIPDPIVGGVLMVMFGMIASVGISSLQFADMNSARNLFIVGFSIVFGLALPYYLYNNPGAIKTGKYTYSFLFASSALREDPGNSPIQGPKARKRFGPGFLKLSLICLPWKSAAGCSKPG